MREKSNSNRPPVPVISTRRPRTKKTMSGKFEIKKFDPVARKHVLQRDQAEVVVRPRFQKVCNWAFCLITVGRRGCPRSDRQCVNPAALSA